MRLRPTDVSDATSLELVVYGDFNCPYSCLASARADILAERGIAAVEWRAVEHDPSLPVPSEPVVGDLAVMLDREVAEVTGLLRADETFPIRRPPVHPNSAAAVAMFAASPPAGSRELRRSLFGALWFEGSDTGDPTVLAALGAEGNDTQRVAAWRNEWLRFDRRVVPMLVLPDGYVSRGLGALGRLADLAFGVDGS